MCHLVAEGGRQKVKRIRVGRAREQEGADITNLFLSVWGLRPLLSLHLGDFGKRITQSTWLVLAID